MQRLRTVVINVNSLLEFWISLNLAIIINIVIQRERVTKGALNGSENMVALNIWIGLVIIWMDRRVRRAKITCVLNFLAFIFEIRVSLISGRMIFNINF